MFANDEQLIKEAAIVDRWRLANAPFTEVTTSENSWADVATPVNTPAISPIALLKSLFPLSPFPFSPSPLPNLAPTIVSLGKALAVDRIQEFFNRPDRLEQFKIAFGQDVDRDRLSGIINDWQTGNKLPDIQILSPQVLGKADGRFDTVNNKIYLSSNPIDRGNFNEIVLVIIEEIGHYFDSKLHPGGDAAGDEGEIFSKLVRGVTISTAEYATLITEDDHATILLPNSSLSTLNCN